MKFRNATLLLASAALALSVVATSTSARAESKFACEPGETYIMNVMVSAHPYWVPVYEGFKQAAAAMGGCETVYSGTPDYDIAKQIASFEQENYPNMKLVGRQASNQDSNAAYRATGSFLQANPNLGAIWIPEAGSAEGAVAAVLEAKADVLVMHADITPTTLEHIKAGNIHMALSPNQGVQGFMGFIATLVGCTPRTD